MGTLGYKGSWMKAERKPKTNKAEQEEIPAIIPGTAVAHILEIQMKISQHEEFFITKEYTKLTQPEKAHTIESYRFLVITLATIQLSQSSEGINIQQYAEACSEIDFDQDYKVNQHIFNSNKKKTYEKIK